MRGEKKNEKKEGEGEDKEQKDKKGKEAKAKTPKQETAWLFGAVTFHFFFLCRSFFVTPYI